MLATRPANPDQIDLSISVVVFETDPDDLATLLGDLSASSLRLKITVVDNSATRALKGVATGQGAAYIKTDSNLGFGAAHNLVLGEMLGHTQYHLVVNPDIRLHAGVLDRIFAFMQQHPEIGQLMPRVLNPDGTQQMLCKLLPTPMDLLGRRFLARLAGPSQRRRAARYELRDVDLSQPTRVPCLSGCFMFLRDSVLQQAGLFDERYFLYMEDFDLCRRVGACSATVFFPEVSITHGYAKGSYRDTRLLRYHLMSAWRYFNKWGWLHDPQRDSLNQLVGPLPADRTQSLQPEYADVT